MAFQGKSPFFDFLQNTAAIPALEHSAPAENYILDERVPDARENDFLSLSGFSASSPATVAEWYTQIVNYSTIRVSRAAVSSTFDTINRPNWLSLQPDWDVVRIETIYGLCSRAGGSDVDETEAMILIQEMLDARTSGRPMDPNREARLEKWLEEVNDGSDQRPAFVAPYVEVEAILSRPDWANRLRDAFGLGHIRPWAGKPSQVLLMQYNLERVFRSHIGKPAWAASPTVMDDVPTAGPNPCFFPAPKSVSTDGYGFTVDLDMSVGSFQREFLHGRIEYKLADIRRIGEITLDVMDSQIEAARNRHRGLLEYDLIHFGDLP